jgi:hypothetical protein
MRRVTSLPSEGLDARGLATMRRQLSLEWRLAPGGAWTFALCHPPVDGLEIEHRTSAEERS